MVANKNKITAQYLIIKVTQIEVEIEITNNRNIQKDE